MAMLSIHPIPAFNDNYIWCIQRDNHAVVVDPGDAAPVLAYCKDNNLSLTAILITHHHWDHTDGIADLLVAFPGIPVYGPHNDIATISHRLAEGDSVSLDELQLTLSVLAVPGHTLDHIAYVSDIGLFCGDTLFSGGCGRLFEGTPAQMHQSLNKLMSLPGDMPVFCTHEYTLANLKFARAVDPQNAALEKYQRWAEQQRQHGKPTLPSNIANERDINPFVRTGQPDVIASAATHSGQSDIAGEQVFAALRGWKDNF
nr:hydroxyacylglutathione hydrolase [Aestuariibacter salexigens]